MEGEATANPPAQSPYTLHTERGAEATRVTLLRGPGREHFTVHHLVLWKLVISDDQLRSYQRTTTAMMRSKVDSVAVVVTGVQLVITRWCIYYSWLTTYIL